MLAAVLALAWWWFSPLLGLGLRNDDFLLVYYLDRDSGGVLWGRVFEEFVRGWFGSPELYRPMVTLSLLSEYRVAGSLQALHLGNVLLVGAAAGATAMLAMRLGAGAWPRRALAGVCAGALVALHPAAVEPAAWILSRTTALQVACTMAALWLFVRHLDGAPRWPYLVLLSMALGTKEGAVTAPFSMLLLDFVYRREVRLGARLRAVLPAFLLLGAYLLLRVVLLGQIGKSGEPVGALERVGNLSVRWLDLLAPAAPGGEPRPWWSLALWAALGASLLRAVGWRGAVLLPWALVLVVPTSHLAPSPGQLDGRLLFDGAPFLALAAGLAVGSGRGGAGAWLTAGLAVCVTIAPAATSRLWTKGYFVEQEQDKALRDAIALAARDATPRAPLAVTGLPVLPLYHYKLWGLLALRPNQAKDLHVLGMPDLLFAPIDRPSQLGDATAVHALLTSGGRVATWRPDTQQLVDLEAPRDGTCVLVRQGDAFTPAKPWPGTSVASVHVAVPGGAGRARLKLLADLDDERSPGWLEEELVDGEAWFDTGRAFAPALFASVGLPFAGVQVEVDGAPPPAATEVTVHGRQRRVALYERVAGADLDLADAGSQIARPPSLRHDVRFHLMLPTGVRSMSVDPSVPFVLDDVVQGELDYAWRLAAPIDLQWFWTGRETVGGPWCSTPLDWARAP